MENGAGGAEAPVAGQRQWRLADEPGYKLTTEDMDQYVRRFHRHEPGSNQCSSIIAKHIKAPVEAVWSLVKRFDQPQLFKPFVKRCVMQGNIETGSVREVNVQTTFRCGQWLLDDNEHIISVKFVGGNHRLKNYSSILTVHSKIVNGHSGTLVIESFIVDVPEENVKDDVCYFVENLLKCNLSSLAAMSEQRADRPSLE